MEESPNEKAFDHVPEDFPRSADMPGLLAGAQPKLALVRYQGLFYAPGFTPPERYERWRKFEELAHVFVEKCLRNEHGKYAHLTRTEILAQYLSRLTRGGYGAETECRWLIRRTASLLGWEVPPDAPPGSTADEMMAFAPPPTSGEASGG
ncbi:MAG TPA: hypothetical protein VF472_16335 [Burkholderiaceae bacterium]